MAKELRDEDGKDQYELSKARKWFQSSINQDDLLVNAYMLTKNNLAFVSGNLVTTNEEEIYGSFYEVEGYTREEWRESILRSHTNYAFLPSAMTNGTFSPNMLGTKEPIIHMIVPISDYGIKSNQVMVYMLSTKRLFHDISPMSHGNLLHLKDKEGNVLAVRERDGTILNGLPEEEQNPSEEQDNWVLIQSGNEITGLEADCYVPQTYFDEILRPAQRMTVLMAVGILFLVAVLSFFMAARHSTSESRTMRMIEKIYPEIMDSGKLDKKKKRAFDDYVLGTIRMLDEKQRNYNERFQIMKNPPCRMDGAGKLQLVYDCVYGSNHAVPSPVSGSSWSGWFSSGRALTRMTMERTAASAIPTMQILSIALCPIIRRHPI